MSLSRINTQQGAELELIPSTNVEGGGQFFTLQWKNQLTEKENISKFPFPHFEEIILVYCVMPCALF